MLKKTLLLAAACGLAFTISTGVSFASDDIKTLQTAKAKKPATFNHTKHQGLPGMTCASCHHSANADGTQGPYVAGKEGTCESCHNSDMANKKLNNFKNAGHALCKDCHKAKAKEGNKNAPTKCAGCHPKKK